MGKNKMGKQVWRIVCMALIMIGCMLHTGGSAYGEEQAQVSLSLMAREETIHAGQLVHYDVLAENTGDSILYDLHLTAEMSGEELHPRWDQALRVCGEENEAVLSQLSPGETARLSFYVKLTESMEGELEAAVHMQDGKKVVCSSSVIPATAAFEVEKTADCQEAAPGERIGYQICIRNTGERTLHSVVSTERFLNAEIRAQFLPTENVTLNKDRSRAMIAQLSPGECVNLKAEVEVPGEIREKNLINQVLVTTEETGQEEPVLAQSDIEVTELNESVEDNSTHAFHPLKVTAPITADRTIRSFYEIAMVFAWAISAGLLWYKYMKWKEKSRH